MRPSRSSFSLAVFLILAYLAATRFSVQHETTFGARIGGVPIFLTDATLGLLLAATFVKCPARLLAWAVSGRGAGPVGAAVWLLCLLAVGQCLSAYPDYHFYALRDLAMFGYSLFFPLTYMVLRGRRDAERVVRCFTFGTLILGSLLAFQLVSGIQFDLFAHAAKVGFSGGGAVQRIGGGELGVNLSFSAAALVAYLLLDREHRPFILAAALVCFMGVAASVNRSAVMAVSAAGLATGAALLRMERAWRVIGAVVVVAGIALMAQFVDLPVSIPLLRNLYVGVASATTVGHDPDVAFRLLRWKSALDLWMTNPILGAGFGVQIAPRDLNAETGSYNFGLPHNTYLTVLVRMGLVGLLIVLFCIGWSIWRMLKALWRGPARPDDLAAVNIIVAMATLAFFDLFFEHPLMCGPFWIMLAAAWRLAETGSGKAGAAAAGTLSISQDER